MTNFRFQHKNFKFDFLRNRILIVNLIINVRVSLNKDTKHIISKFCYTVLKIKFRKFFKELFTVEKIWKITSTTSGLQSLSIALG